MGENGIEDEVGVGVGGAALRIIYVGGVLQTLITTFPFLYLFGASSLITFSMKRRETEGEKRKVMCM